MKASAAMLIDVRVVLVTVGVRVVLVTVGVNEVPPL